MCHGVVNAQIPGGINLRRLNTVRTGYLYVIGGSLLLSGGVLMVLQAVVSFLYSQHSADSGAFTVRLLHWMINHIGRLPLAVILLPLFPAVFSAAFAKIIR